MRRLGCTGRGFALHVRLRLTQPRFPFAEPPTTGHAGYHPASRILPSDPASGRVAPPFFRPFRPSPTRRGSRWIRSGKTEVPRVSGSPNTGMRSPPHKSGVPTRHALGTCLDPGRSRAAAPWLDLSRDQVRIDTVEQEGVRLPRSGVSAGGGVRRGYGRHRQSRGRGIGCTDAFIRGCGRGKLVYGRGVMGHRSSTTRPRQEMGVRRTKGTKDARSAAISGHPPASFARELLSNPCLWDWKDAPRLLPGWVPFQPLPVGSSEMPDVFPSPVDLDGRFLLTHSRPRGRHPIVWHRVRSGLGPGQGVYLPHCASTHPVSFSATICGGRSRPTRHVGGGPLRGMPRGTTSKPGCTGIGTR